MRGWPKILVVLGIALFAAGHIWGLFYAPREKYMGDVGRILYMHMPVAMMSLFACTISFVTSVLYLFTKKWRFDHRAEASAEVAVILAALALITGSIWGKPTWGAWWSWDPRLTTMLILFFSYIGYLTLRHYVEEPEQRASWSGVSGILIGVNVPLVYFSVQLFETLHQVQSTPETVDGDMKTPLRISLTGIFLLTIGWTAWRARLAERRLRAQLAEEPA